MFVHLHKLRPIDVATMIRWSTEVLAARPNWTSSRRIRCYRVVATGDRYTFANIPNKEVCPPAQAQADIDIATHDKVVQLGAGGWRQDQIGPHQDAYDVVVSLLRVMMA
jgi:hypothetical protein